MFAAICLPKAACIEEHPCGITRGHRSQTDSGSTDTEATTNPAYSFTYRPEPNDSSTDYKSLVRSLCKSWWWRVLGALFVLVIFFLLPYFAVNMATLFKDFGDLQARVIQLEGT
ncbi:hypothetical protein Bbelb_192950 [Branchiostoma belcheri]|nr:hypothetical protein Bbelb_192950 [Branchiostoma belcheri]